MKVRLFSQARVGRSKYNGVTYEGSVGVGFALGSAEKDDEFDLFFEQSSLSADVVGGSYGADDGEAVLAAGYGSSGFGKIAAWIFKGFALNDDVDIGFDATGSVEFDNEGSFAFCEISLNISRDCRLT